MRKEGRTQPNLKEEKANNEMENRNGQENSMVNSFSSQFPHL